MTNRLTECDPNDVPALPAKRSGRRRALLVGINDYPGFGRDLPSCINDVEAMAEFLSKTHEFDCEVLVDAEASQDALRRGLHDLCSGTTPEDRILFYYSGHGAFVPRIGSIEECLVLADGALFPDDDFVTTFSDVPPGSALVILDSCFSGGLAKDWSGRGAMVKSVPIISEVAHTALRKGGKYKPFGGRARSTFGGFSGARKKALIESDEADDGTLNALLLSACLENETADASTSLTQGLSAFTYSVLNTVAVRGEGLAMTDLIVEATAELRRIGALQTPQIKEPVTPAMMADMVFPLLDRPKAVQKTALPRSESRAKLSNGHYSTFTDSTAKELDGPLASALFLILSKLQNDWPSLQAPHTLTRKSR